MTAYLILILRLYLEKYYQFGLEHEYLLFIGNLSFNTKIYLLSNNLFELSSGIKEIN